MGRKIIKTLFVLAAMVLCSCRKDLCYDHTHGLICELVTEHTWELNWEYDHGANWRSNWNAAWFGFEYEDFTPDAANGVAAIIYNESGTNNEHHMAPNGGKIAMTEGKSQMLFYNDDTEYILFNDITQALSASATTRTRVRSTYTEFHSNEQTVNAPDMLFVEWVDEYTATPAELPDTLEVLLKPMVYTYLIRYEFERGAEHIALARGALAGMAESVYLAKGETSTESVTILFDCSTTPSGAIAEVSSFGTPNLDSRELNFGLNLEVMMKNGEIKNFEFDITNQLLNQPRGGVITVSGLVIEENEAGVSSGFEVDVTDWGEFQDIIIPLGRQK